MRVASKAAGRPPNADMRPDAGHHFRRKPECSAIDRLQRMERECYAALVDLEKVGGNDSFGRYRVCGWVGGKRARGRQPVRHEQVKTG